MKTHSPEIARAVFSHTRRKLMGLISTSAAAVLAPFAVAARTRESSRCIVRPEQTEGPYFLDERLRRSDIRSDPQSGVVKPGAPLRLAFRVSQIGGQTCRPLEGAIVDLWQCDAMGIYSGVQDFAGRFDTRGQTFLRGYQMTDANGVARFMTVYPGWYPGRAVHVHFKIRTPTGRTNIYEFTSQLYFDDTLTDRIHAQPPYAKHLGRRTTNREDRIFQRSGKQLMLRIDGDARGYEAAFDIALQVPASFA